MQTTDYQRICSTLILGAVAALTLPACGGGGEELDAQAIATPGGNSSPAPGGSGSPAPGGDGDAPGSGACSAAGAPDAARRMLSNGDRQALVASCNGAAPGLIDIIENFLPPPVPASGAKG